ncbi:hypothetical protein [Paenibacillus sp. 22594]|uniref:hypothetical protein n=1 Tax=Paenibacillus sp. 22594 TaxID=3453947 RepID=UPI003F838504
MDSGSQFTVVSKTSGSVWSWGASIKGQLGDETFIILYSYVKYTYHYRKQKRNNTVKIILRPN